MPAITHGTLFEPRVRCPEMADGLSMRVHDPLWMVARQWQFGELQADDAGSPCLVDVQAEAAPITRYSPGRPQASSARDYRGAEVPLEVLVEAEPAASPAAVDEGLALEAGVFFLRLLGTFGAGPHRGAYRTRYARPRPDEASRRTWDDESERALDLAAGRIPDAIRLRRDLAAALGPRGDGPGGLPSDQPIPEADRPKVLAAARAWLRWYAESEQVPPVDGGPPPPAWSSERMEYEFSVAARHADGEVVLTAQEYPGGHLDWYAFGTAAGASLGASAGSTVRSSRFLPAPVAFRGMPSPRLWEFEDARVNLGRVRAEPEDLARLILLEFALVYSNDWFLTPLEVEVGSVCRVRSLVVTDTFGERTRIPHYAQVDGPGSPWKLFALSPDREAAHGPATPPEHLFLAPVLASGLESAPIEEVLLLRDEMANVAWAVERVVQGPAGRPLDRHESYHAAVRRRERSEPARPPEPGPPGASTLRYRLGSSVPEHWIPFVVAEQPSTSGTPGPRLRRARLPAVSTEGPARPVVPLGRILSPERELSLFDEVIPREGSLVRRTYQYARWIGGSTFQWVGWVRKPGRGEGSSGLRFDFIEPAQ